MQARCFAYIFPHPALTCTQRVDVFVPGGVPVTLEALAVCLVVALIAGKFTRRGNVETATGIKVSILYVTGTTFHCNRDMASESVGVDGHGCQVNVLTTARSC